MLNAIIFIEGFMILTLCVYILILKKNPKGEIVITQDDSGKKTFTLELGVDPDEIMRMDTISFKVTHEASEDD